ncbi:hypothetical protein C8J57DRAFT_1561492 [Mycena rebaudengoi]|nr:hypothetical protein C8J57DRAFT_1561492 [Mycena rebaudengoi]
MRSATDTFVGVEEGEDEYGYELRGVAPLAIRRAAAANNNNNKLEHANVNHRPTPATPQPTPQHHHHHAPRARSPGPLTALKVAQTPVTPTHCYTGWVAAAVAPLEEFIDEPIDPRDVYVGLREIAEDESGNVFAAEIARDAPVHRLRLPPLAKRDLARVLVAIKSVALIPDYDGDDGADEGGVGQSSWASGGSWRCCGGRGASMCWRGMRLDLMERGLANMVGPVEKGLRLQEPSFIARFASNALFLQKHHMAPRDLRSDNLLLSGDQARVAALCGPRQRSVLAGAGGRRVVRRRNGVESSTRRPRCPLTRSCAVPARVPRVFQAVLRACGGKRGAGGVVGARARTAGDRAAASEVYGHRVGAAGRSLRHDAHPSSTNTAPLRTSSSFLLRCTPYPQALVSGVDQALESAQRPIPQCHPQDLGTSSTCSRA